MCHYHVDELFRSVEDHTADTAVVFENLIVSDERVDSLQVSSTVNVKTTNNAAANNK